MIPELLLQLNIIPSGCFLEASHAREALGTGNWLSDLRETDVDRCDLRSMMHTSLDQPA